MCRAFGAPVVPVVCRAFGARGAHSRPFTAGIMKKNPKPHDTHHSGDAGRVHDTGHIRDARDTRDTRALAEFDVELARDWGQRLGLGGPARLAGVDEAGRGPLAGPVVAGAVVLPPGLYLPGLTDSKKLSARRRDQFFEAIQSQALAVAAVAVSAETIDVINILNATRLAARLALDALPGGADLIALDALTLAGETRPQVSLVRGDSTSQSIAAASVVAKVTRDRLMARYDAEFPEYGFIAHKGYGVAAHLQTLRDIGPCSIHRMSFSGVCFFDQSWRPSRFYRALEAELAGRGGPPAPLGPLGPPEAAGLLERVESQAAFLPDREIVALRAMIGKAGGGGDGAG